MKIGCAFFKSEFARNVLTLMTGTSIAQAIPIAISPILTRLYSPEDFGILTLYITLSIIIGEISNFRYEMAIMLPKEGKEAFNIMILGIIIATGISSVLFIVILLFNSQITSMLNEEKISIWLYLIPATVFLMGVFNALNYLNTREKNYKKISSSQITKSTSSGLIQIGSALVANGPFGLIFGFMMSYLPGNSILWKPIRKKYSIKKYYDRKTLKSQAIKYIRFPIYSVPSTLANVFSRNIINILISTLFNTRTLGFYTLARKVMGLPMIVLGLNVGQVYFQQASVERINSNSTKRIFLKTLLRLSLISIPIFTAVFFIVEPAFVLVFGKEWQIAGHYAKILLPLAAARFVSSSLAVTLDLHEKQNYSLYTNVILLGTIISLFILVKIFSIPFTETLIYYAIALSIEYLSFIYIYYRVSVNKVKVKD